MWACSSITIELKLKLSENSKITQNCPHVCEINNTLLKKPFEEETRREIRRYFKVDENWNIAIFEMWLKQEK